MFYLGKRQDVLESDGKRPSEDNTTPATDTPLDNLEELRRRLEANRTAGGGVKYEVNRDNLQAPVVPPPPAGSPPGLAKSAPAGGPLILQTPSDKELLDLQGRLWAMCYRDDNIGMYVCIKSKNPKKQLLRLDIRCEKIGEVNVSQVDLKLPADIRAQEADSTGTLVIVPGELQERSPKVKMNLDLTCFVSPMLCSFTCEIQYHTSESESSIVGAVQLSLPLTTLLAPSPMSSDEVSSATSQNAEFFSQKADQDLKLEVPGRNVEEMCRDMPVLLGRCAALCNFYGLLQTPSPQVWKLLLVACPPKCWGLPDAAFFVCLCSAKVSGEILNLRIAGKSCRQEISEAIVSRVGSVLRELVEGRLRVS